MILFVFLLCVVLVVIVAACMAFGVCKAKCGCSVDCEGGGDGGCSRGYCCSGTVSSTNGPEPGSPVKGKGDVGGPETTPCQESGSKKQAEECD